MQKIVSKLFQDFLHLVNFKMNFTIILADNNTIWSHEGPSSGKLLILTLFKWQTKIKVHLLPVYSPVREEIEEPWFV